MNLNDLLVKREIDPKGVVVLRHRPDELELRRVLPWLAAEHHHLFNAYQQTHGPRVQASLQRADYVASFIGHEPGSAQFVGLYEIAGTRPLTYEDFWRVPEYVELHDRFGMRGWTEIVLPWEELGVLPGRWKVVLKQWRGIYYIFDESDGKGYVGSAYSGENLLGRWLNYAATGHGGNRLLRERDPRHFRFSILQRLSPDMDAADVIRLEGAWKDRLHTRAPLGLNDN